MTRILPLLLALASVGASCRRDPPTAASASDDALCAHLAQLGCPTGRDPNCPISLARLRVLGPVPEACVSRASSAAGVRACGLECAP